MNKIIALEILRYNLNKSYYSDLSSENKNQKII
jgi:hypothetical protein